MNTMGAFRAAGFFALGTLMLSNSMPAAPPLGVYDGNGVLLGTYLASDTQHIEFASPKGYVAEIRVDDEESSEPDGTIGGTLDSARTWNSTDCSGLPLTGDAVAGRLAWIDTPVPELGYVATGAVAVTLQAGATVSGYSSGGTQCVTRTLSRSTTFLPVLPNDPTVTGIGGGVAALPIKIALIDSIFDDGFERLS